METTQPLTETALAQGKAAKTVGWILTILAILFCLFDVFGKLTKPEAVLKGTIGLGYPEGLITPIGIILLICTILYAIPRTSFYGAILLTAYLGGAVASCLRIEAPLFSNTLFPVYFAILVWAGLILRSSKLRYLFTHTPF